MAESKDHRTGIMTDARAASLAELGEYYKSSEGYRAHLEAKGPAYFEQFVHVVCGCSNPNNRILDVGCGTGESTRNIMRRNRNVVGTDLSTLFLRAEKTDGSVQPQYVTSDASQLPFADNSFDVVCAMEFIEHVWPVEAVLTEMYRVVRPFGRIVIMSPNLLSPLWPVRDLIGMFFQRRFRPPFYTSYREALMFFRQACRLSLQKMLSREAHFVPREPNLACADSGGDFDSVYASHARDLMLFLQKAGCEVDFAPIQSTSFRSWVRRSIARCFGSLWTSFLIEATKQPLKSS